MITMLPASRLPTQNHNDSAKAKSAENARAHHNGISTSCNFCACGLAVLVVRLEQLLHTLHSGDCLLQVRQLLRCCHVCHRQQLGFRGEFATLLRSRLAGFVRSAVVIVWVCNDCHDLRRNTQKVEMGRT